MKTKTKVFLASIAYRAVSTVRNMTGRGTTATVTRGGIGWRLDLSEGIDFSIYLLGSFEPSTRAALNRLIRAGNVAFDIGANIGAHTLPMARRVGPEGRIFAFEPTDFAFGKLKANIELNPNLQSRIEAHQLLLTDEPGVPVSEKIYSSWPLVPESDQSVHPKHRGRLTTTRNARANTLDAFVEQHRIDRLDLIKIDVDGNEYPVLHGGSKTLAKLRPTLLMEISPYVHQEQSNSFASLIDLLRETGYSLREVGTGRQLPMFSTALEKMIPDGSSINAIAKAE